MLETAIEVLEKCAQLVTASEEWGYESVTMEKEEIEIGTLPKDVHLPRLVMTHLYIYCAPEDGKDYVFISLQILPASENLFVGYW